MTEAAEHLGITPRRARRWIRLGKLPAELRIGPYGLQYFLPARAIRADDRTPDGAPAPTPPAGAATTYAHAVDRYFSEGENVLLRAVETLRDENWDANKRQEQWEASLRNELLRSYHDLAATVEAPRRSQPVPAERAETVSRTQAMPLEAWRPPGSTAPPRPSVDDHDAPPKLDESLHELREKYRQRLQQGWLKLVR